MHACQWEAASLTRAAKKSEHASGGKVRYGEKEAHRCVSITASVSGLRASTTRGPIVMSAPSAVMINILV